MLPRKYKNVQQVSVITTASRSACFSQREPHMGDRHPSTRTAGVCTSWLGASPFQPLPSKFLGEIIARHEMGRESVVIIIHPTSKPGTQLAQQPSYSAWRGPCPPHFPGPKHPPLFGTGRGSQRAAFEQSLQFKRKNT